MLTLIRPSDGKRFDVPESEVANFKGWQRAEPIAATPDRTQRHSRTPHSLADLVDDRAMPALADIGVTDVESFVLVADADEESLIALPYVTAKTIAKVRREFFDD